MSNRDGIDRFVLLRTFPGFSELDIDEIARLSRLAELENYTAGDVLNSAEDALGAMFFVVRGRLRVTRVGADRIEFSSGESVGVLESVVKDLTPTEVVAAEDTEVLVIDSLDFSDLLEDSDALMLASTHYLASALVDVFSVVPAEAWQVPTGVVDPGCFSEPPGFVDRLFFLRQNASFAAGRMQALAALARASEFVSFEEGASPFRDGQKADHGLLVVSGRIVGTLPSGNELHFQAGDDVGTIESLGGRRRWFTARCSTRVQALRLRSADLLDVLEDEPELTLALVQVLCESLLELSAAFPDLADRLAAVSG